MQICSIDELIVEELLPMSIIFPIMTRDAVVYELLETKGYIDIFYIRSYHGLKKKICSSWYNRYIDVYSDILDYDIFGGVIIEWLDLKKFKEKNQEYYELFDILKTLA